ncbi:unnamed protein product [Musa textilis]
MKFFVNIRTYCRFLSVNQLRSGTMGFGYGTTTCTRSTVMLLLMVLSNKCTTEMASRHRVRCHCIQIIKTATIPSKLCKREGTKQFHDSKIKFALVFKKVRPPTRKLRTTYKASRPNLFV